MELRGQSQEKSVELESLVGHGKNVGVHSKKWATE